MGIIIEKKLSFLKNTLVIHTSHFHKWNNLNIKNMERLSDKLFINLNRNYWLKFILYNQLYLQFIAFDRHIDYLITKSLCLFMLMGGAFVTEVPFESFFKSLLDLSSQSSMSNLGKVLTLQNWQVSQGKLSHSFSTFQNQRWGTIFSIICLWIPYFPPTPTNTRKHDLNVNMGINYYLRRTKIFFWETT